MNSTNTSQHAGKSILITGCSSGIGLCCARGMRDRGWRVLATARTDADLAMLEEDGIEPIALELMDPASIAACAEAALTRTDGKLYALFNNAAYGQPGAVEDLTPDVLRMQFEANVFSWHDLTRRIIPTMRENGVGRIVQCSSVLGMISPPWRGAYNASKHAIEALSAAMRHELAQTGVKVSVIRPGPIESRFVDHALAALRDNVDIENSTHVEAYKVRLEALAKGGAVRFKLGPEAVLKTLIHAVESPYPKLVYRVTMPTHFAEIGRRVLPTRVGNWLVGRS